MRLSFLAFCIAASLAGIGRGAEGPKPIAFTPEQARWIKQHPEVRLGADPAWPPFSFIGKDGRHQGIDAEILQLVAERVGIRFVLVPAKSWAETEALALAHELDVTSSTAITEERAKALDFTRPYISTPVAVVMREDAPFWIGLRSLAGRTVATPRGHVTTEFLEREYPELKLRLVDDLGAALELVAGGEADAAVSNLVAVSHLIKTRGLRNLKVAGLMKERFDLRLAVRNDQPELLAILDKALATITEREELAIVERWIGVNIEDAINWRLIRTLGTWVALVGGGIFGAGFLWNRRLARELAERRKVEAALRENEAQLRTANAGLRSLNDDRRTMMNMVAHDLNGPLTALTLAVGQARDQTLPESPVLRDLDEIKHAAERMGRLVGDLLSAEAIERGERMLRRVPVDLGALVRSVMSRLARTAVAKEIALDFSDRGTGGARVEGDPSALDQVIENLIGNAVKFTPGGGRVEVAMEGDGPHVRLTFSDTGPGVRAEDRPRLFVKFARLSARPTGGETSNGLGLAIVRMLTAAMGGDVAYEDAPGGGARFVVTLPCSHPVPAPVEAGERSRRCILFFVKHPTPGRVKTRIAATAGGERAAEIYRTLAETVLRRLPRGDEIVVMGDPPEQLAAIMAWLGGVSGGRKLRGCPQAEGDLGVRLERAFASAFAEGCEAVAAIGSDCLEIAPALFAAVWDSLVTHDVALGPTLDGGYYLIALRQPHAALFRDIPWSTDAVYRETLARAAAAGLRVHVLPPLRDVDTEEDWRRVES